MTRANGPDGRRRARPVRCGSRRGLPGGGGWAARVREALTDCDTCSCSNRPQQAAAACNMRLAGADISACGVSARSPSHRLRPGPGPGPSPP